MFLWFIIGLLLGIVIGGIIAFRYGFDKGMEIIFGLLMNGGIEFDDLKFAAMKGIDKYFKEKENGYSSK